MVLTWKEKLYFLLWGSGSMESMGEFLKSLGRMFLYGAVFGIAAGLFLIMTKNFFEKGKESKEKQSSLSAIVKDKESITDKIDSIKTDLQNEEEKSLSNQKKKETADQRKKSSIQEAYDKAAHKRHSAKQHTLLHAVSSFQSHRSREADCRQSTS